LPKTKTKKEKVDPKQLEKELKAISKEEGGLDVKEDSKNKIPISKVNKGVIPFKTAATEESITVSAKANK